MAEDDIHLRHHFLGEPDEDLIESLEPDQLVSAMAVPVPRRRLSRPAQAALWALRVQLLVMTLGVVYVFVKGLSGSS